MVGSSHLAVPFAPGLVALGGSRQLPLWGALLVEAVVSHLLGRGHYLAVGCCVGADQVALGACPPQRVRVLAAFGPVSPPFEAPSGRYSAPGSWRSSAVGAVAAHLLAGGAVSWWAGGGPQVALRQRLASRSAALAKLATAGAVVFVSSPHSRGSFLLAGRAAARGLPVVVFPLGFPAEELPPLSPQGGSWVLAGQGLWGLGWRWLWAGSLL